MRGLRATYKRAFVFAGGVRVGLTDILCSFKADIDLAIRRIYDRADRQAAGIVGDPDHHAAFALDEPICAEYLRLDAKTPLLSEDRFLLLTSGHTYRNFINKTGFADRHTEGFPDSERQQPKTVKSRYQIVVDVIYLGRDASRRPHGFIRISFDVRDPPFAVIEERFAISNAFFLHVVLDGTDNSKIFGIDAALHFLQETKAKKFEQ